MVHFIISTVLLISPADTVNTPFDITIVFEPAITADSIEVSIDKEKIEGEKKADYFFSIIENLESGKHEIRVVTSYGELIDTFYVSPPPEIKVIDLSGNISTGIENSYSRNALNSEYTEAIIGSNLSLFYGERYAYLSILHEPDYEIDVLPYLNYSGRNLNVEAGYIYPFLDELTIYSPEGFGIYGEINLGNFQMKPLYLYSRSYDTLFFEYPRTLYGGSILLSLDRITLSNHIFYAEDDTTDITGFPILSPVKSLVIAPEIDFKITRNLDLKILYAFSKALENIYQDTTKAGKALELSSLYESDYNSLEIGLRWVGDDYLSPGNPYLYTGRKTLFFEGFYDMEYFSTDFSHSVYTKNSERGYYLYQSMKYKFSNKIGPRIEFILSKYPEYGGEKYIYGAIGLDLDFYPIQFYSLFGMDKYDVTNSEISFRSTFSLYWYPGEHSFSLGGTISNRKENPEFDFNLDSRLKIGNLGYLNIYYAPSIEGYYQDHLLRIIYEYSF